MITYIRDKPTKFDSLYKCDTFFYSTHSKECVDLVMERFPLLSQCGRCIISHSNIISYKVYYFDYQLEQDLYIAESARLMENDTLALRFVDDVVSFSHLFDCEKIAVPNPINFLNFQEGKRKWTLLNERMVQVFGQDSEKEFVVFLPDFILEPMNFKELLSENDLHQNREV